MTNRLIIAAAGSGKTTYLVKCALQETKNILITTYTIANENEIRKKFIELNGCVPPNVTIKTWYSLLLQHGVKPFQGVFLEDDVKGMILVNGRSGVKYVGKRGPVYYSEEELRKFYFTEDMKMYSDKIAKFVCRCDEKTNGAVIKRISNIFSKVFIDEIQDMAGYDLEVIKSLLKAECDVLMVGDPRQVTYHTHNEAKYRKYSNGDIEGFLKNECKKIKYDLDSSTLNNSYRNNDLICEYSSELYPEYSKTGSLQIERTSHDGVFLVRPKDVRKYLSIYNALQLRDKRTVKVDDKYPVINMGESKGLTMDRVLIYPTKAMKDWMKEHTTELKPKTKSQFYVALTRAKYSVGIVYDFDESTSIPGVKRYSGS